ncbi:Hypothetical predicted protein [Pelobates cultripes]|uniref:Uncharacterized protein n=1 Tax=Pelobates cultripes TaxID=61616 RepID=A0AAD1VQ31_PELCU|nr:Hypothetical predicted protein [Pelobates cultripes]
MPLPKQLKLSEAAELQKKDRRKESQDGDDMANTMIPLPLNTLIQQSQSAVSTRCCKNFELQSELTSTALTAT